MQTGDKVYVGRFYGYDHHFTLGEVTAVTPKGYVDVRIGAAPEPRRFRPNGREVGADRYRGYYIDDTPVAEREALLAQEQRTKDACRAIAEVNVRREVNPRWGKDGLQGEVERLQKLLDAARAAVAAI